MESPAQTGSCVDESHLAPLRFDRRTSPRWDTGAEVVATAFVLGGGQFGRMIDLRILDQGHDGIGAAGEEPVIPGTVVSLGFSAAGMLARRGVVTRCAPSGDGYRLGIRFEARLAA